MNKVELEGFLGKDVEMKYTSSGVPVANMNLATTERWTDRDGKEKSDTQWHRVVAWRDLAESVTDLHKGDLVRVEGKITYRKWRNKDGQDVYVTEIVARGIQKLEKKKKSEPREDKTDDLPF